MSDAAPGTRLTRETARDFYDAYYDTLDQLRLEAWPAFFATDCRYRIISRENFERGFPLATVLAESRGMLLDRVAGLTRVQVYAPRYYRRFPGPLHISLATEACLSIEHNLLMVQTLIDKQTEIVLAARCYDRLILEDDRPVLASRDVVFDSEMLPNSLVYPA